MRGSTYHKLITIFFLFSLFVGLGFLSGCEEKTEKEVYYVAYMGRRNKTGEIYASANGLDKKHELIVNHFINQLNEERDDIEIRLKVFNCNLSGERSDSIYKHIIAPDTSILMVIDNTYGSDLATVRETINQLTIPVVAINADKNNLDYNQNVIFTGNCDYVPQSLADFIVKVQDVRKVGIISDNDNFLQPAFFDAFEAHDISLTDTFFVTGDPAQDPQAKDFLILRLEEYLSGFDEGEQIYLVLNTYNRWSTEVLDFINIHYDNVTVIGHEAAFSGYDKIGFSKDKQNELILLSISTETLNERLSVFMSGFTAENPDYESDKNLEVVVKRCFDAVQFFKGAYAITDSVLSRDKILRSFRSYASNTLVGSDDIYHFDNELVLLRDNNFSVARNGRIFGYPQQLNYKQEVIPNIFFGMDVRNIRDIDINTNSFTADFNYWVKMDTQHVDVENYISFSNIQQNESTIEPIVEENYGNMIFKLFRVSGKFYVDYDLRNYPLDKQEIKIDIEALQPYDKLKVSFDESSLSRANEEDHDRFHVTGWEELDFYVSVDEIITNSLNGDPDAGEELHKYPKLSFHLSLERNITGGLLQIVLPLILIGLISISTLFVKIPSFENLGEVSVGTFLGIIAFSISFSTMTPNVSYLTKADLLFWLTFMVVFTSFMMIVVLNSLYYPDKVAEVKIGGIRISIALIYATLAIFILVK